MIKVGQRVKFKLDTAIPIFNYELEIGGQTGTVIEVDDTGAAIKLDFLYHSLEEWDNCVQYLPEDFPRMFASLEKVEST